MRILNYHRRAASGDGGITNSVRQLSAAMARAGAEPVIVSDDDAPPTEIPGVEWRQLHHRSFRIGAVPSGLREALADADAVIVNSAWTAQNAAVGRACRRLGVPYVCAPRGAYDPRITKRRAPVKRAWWAAAERSLVQGARALHVFFDSEREHLRSLGYHGDVVVAPNGVVVPEDRRWRRGGDHVLYLGRYDPEHKGLDLLLAALARTPAEEVPTLRMHGSDWAGGKERVRRLAAELDLEGRVVIGDHLRGDDKWEAFAAARAFAYPSRWEAFGNSAAEAAALGVPSLLTPYPLGRHLAERSAAVLARPDADALAEGLRRVVADDAAAVGDRAAACVRGGVHLGRGGPGLARTDVGLGRRPAMKGTVVVTGSSGAIGSATVRWFLAAGWTVLGLDRAPAPIEDRAYHHVVVALDDDEALGRELDAALDGLPPLRHVVAVAGGALPGEVETDLEPWLVTPELFRSSLDANLATQFLTVRATVPRLLDEVEVDRSIVLTSSFNGFTAQGMPAYSAAKAGLQGLMQGFVAPLGTHGVRVNVVAPGTILTPPHRTALVGGAGPLRPAGRHRRHRSPGRARRRRRRHRGPRHLDAPRHRAGAVRGRRAVPRPQAHRLSPSADHLANRVERGGGRPRSHATDTGERMAQTMDLDPLDEHPIPPGADVVRPTSAPATATSTTGASTRRWRTTVRPRCSPGSASTPTSAPSTPSPSCGGATCSGRCRPPACAPPTSSTRPSGPTGWRWWSPSAVCTSPVAGTTTASGSTSGSSRSTGRCASRST